MRRRGESKRESGEIRDGKAGEERGWRAEVEGRRKTGELIGLLEKER